jgi:hypothetical protein
VSDVVIEKKYKCFYCKGPTSAAPWVYVRGEGEIVKHERRPDEVTISAGTFKIDLWPSCCAECAGGLKNPDTVGDWQPIDMLEIWDLLVDEVHKRRW